MNEFENRVSTLLRECADAARPYDQLDAALADTASIAVSTAAPPPARRWAVLTAASIVVIAGLYVVAARSTSSQSANQSGTSQGAAPLLFPPGVEPIGAPVESPPGRFSTLLSSPTGTLYVIDLFENFWGSLPSGTSTRTINGHVFGDLGNSGEIGSNNSYALLEPCSMTFTRAPASAQPWDDEVVALLSAETATRGHTTVTLPSGWAMLTKPAEQVTSYEYTVENAIAGSPAAIWTAPGTDVSAIFGAYGTPQTTHRADFDGHQAWFSVYPAANNHLTWASAGNAYGITARGATEQQLVAFARTLQPATISQLQTNSERAGGQWTPATIASTVPAPAQACDARALAVEPSS